MDIVARPYAPLARAVARWGELGCDDLMELSLEHARPHRPQRHVQGALHGRLPQLRTAALLPAEGKVAGLDPAAIGQAGALVPARLNRFTRTLGAGACRQPYWRSTR